VISLPIVHITISDVITDGFFHEYQVLTTAYYSEDDLKMLRITEVRSIHKKLNSFNAFYLRNGEVVKKFTNEDVMGKWLDVHCISLGDFLPDDTFTLTEKGLSLLTSIPYLSHENDLQGDLWS